MSLATGSKGLIAWSIEKVRPTSIQKVRREYLSRTLTTRQAAKASGLWIDDEGKGTRPRSLRRTVGVVLT